MRESVIRMNKLKDDLLAYFENPSEEKCLLYNFRMVIEGNYPPAILHHADWWKKTEKEIERCISLGEELINNNRLKELAVQAFIVGGCFDYELSKRNFIDCVYKTLQPEQIVQFNQKLIRYIFSEYEIIKEYSSNNQESLQKPQKTIELSNVN